jgi:hypothetical protein
VPSPAHPDRAHGQCGANPGGRVTGRNRTGTSRLAPGQLTALVLRHMRTYPDLDFSPYELAKALHRSHGTIRRTLVRLAEVDTVTRTQYRPARFRITT